jgi:hypothetical protein
MNHLNNSVRGLSLIVKLNLDRIMVVGMLCLALLAATYISHP